MSYEFFHAFENLKKTPCDLIYRHTSKPWRY